MRKSETTEGFRKDFSEGINELDYYEACAEQSSQSSMLTGMPHYRGCFNNYVETYIHGSMSWKNQNNSLRCQNYGNF